MAAPSRPTTRREEIHFPLNAPVTVALKYAQGRHVSGVAGERVMFTTADNRVLFLDLEVAARIERLDLNVGEAFTLTKRGENPKGPFTWEVARALGEQPNGTLVIPALPQSADSPAAAPRKPVASALLVDEATALVDAYAEVLQRALTTHQGRVKPDEVRALLITSYIQRNKLSSVA